MNSLCDLFRRQTILTIFKTDKEEWTLSGTLRLFVENNIWAMCHTKLADGTSCLLLCLPWAQRVTTVEMIGGRTRWNVGKEQMGEKFKLWSICTDDDNRSIIIYVADFAQRMIQILSVADGTVINRFNHEIFHTYSLFTVRFYNQHLYVEHKNAKSSYSISKFKTIDKW